MSAKRTGATGGGVEAGIEAGAERHAYPFSAIVGQEDLRLALLLLAVDPRLGGVLIQGEKGTAKTTAVRGLAALLPGHTGLEGRTGKAAPAGPEGSAAPAAGAATDASENARGAFVELPLSATEDRVVGSIDVHSLVADGAASLRPGLVSAADGGVLYVDEVNLLADNLVDVLLDAAATGRVTVERDGISASAQSRFALVGTMNPEEGELRPQLLDRFGLSVEVAAPNRASERVEVITRRLAFDSDPAAFVSGFDAAERAQSARIARARGALADALIPLRELRRIALVCLETEVQGLRADVVCARAAKAHAVLDGRSSVTEADVRAVASFVLPHRRRTDPFDSSGMSEEEIDAAFDAAATALDELESEDDDENSQGSTSGDAQRQPDDDPDGGPGDDDTGGTDDGGDPDPGPGDGPDDGPGPSGPGGARERDQEPDPDDGAGPRSSDGRADDREPPADSTDAEERSPEDEYATDGPMGRGLRGVDLRAEAPGRPLLLRLGGVAHGSRGRRSSAVTTNGRNVSAAVGARGARLDLVTTVRAAAARWAEDGRVGEAGADPAGDRARRAGHRTLDEGDLRYARRLGRSGDLVAFCVDTSGSMAARRRLELVARSAVAVLRDSYVRRDLVGVVTAGGSGATVALAPCRSVDLAVASLGNAPTGGRTPLAEGLAATRRMLAAHRLRDPERRAIVLVLTDGRATAGAGARERALAEARKLGSIDGVAPLVVDCESGRVRLGTARQLARSMHAPVIPLEGLTSGGVAELVRAR